MAVSRFDWTGVRNCVQAVLAFDPDYQPDIQVSGLQHSYSEDLDLEDPWDEEGEDPAVR